MYILLKILTSGAPIMLLNNTNNIVVNKLDGSNSSVYTRPVVFVSIKHQIHSHSDNTIGFAFLF